VNRGAGHAPPCPRLLFAVDQDVDWCVYATQRLTQAHHFAVPTLNLRLNHHVDAEDLLLVVQAPDDDTDDSDDSDSDSDSDSDD